MPVRLCDTCFHKSVCYMPRNWPEASVLPGECSSVVNEKNVLVTTDTIMEKNSQSQDHKCVICKKNWVDVENGYDTCKECLRNI